MKICLFILMVVSISCESYSDAELQDLSNYVLKRKDTIATGNKREVYVFKRDRVYSFERVYWSDGNLMFEYFLRNNRFNGLCIAYTPDGKPGVKIYYKNGLKNGRFNWL